VCALLRVQGEKRRDRRGPAPPPDWREDEINVRANGTRETLLLAQVVPSPLGFPPVLATVWIQRLPWSPFTGRRLWTFHAARVSVAVSERNR